MDPAMDPPPLAVEPATAVPFATAATATAAAASTAAAPVANPTPTRAPTHNHPPYAEMITAALTALNERNGSSKQAIAKYIETNYSNLPPTHSTLLTTHLKRLKANNQVLMVKHSYKLPRSAPVAPNGAADAVSSDPPSAVTKRRPGRPPKPKPDAIQAPVAVFAPPVDMNAVPEVVQPENVAIGPGPVYVPVGPANGAAEVAPKRGRGRPKGGFKRGRGRPPKNPLPIGGGVVGLGRGRGRPKKNAAVAAPGRPRGRPPKPINVVEGLAPAGFVGGEPAVAPAAVGVANVVAPPAVGGGVLPVTGKRRGRPPKAGGVAKKPRNLNAGQPKQPRKFSGRPLGRPRKNISAAVNRGPDSQLLVAYLDLKAKLETLQARVRQTVALITPTLTNEAAINALEDLEMAALNVNAPPPIVQNQQPPQPEQLQQEQQPQAQS